MSEGFLAAYVRHGLHAARRWQQAYDAAIDEAPDDDSRHLMVRFAEQCRVRVDVMERLLHDLGEPADDLGADWRPDGGEPDSQVRWWWTLHTLWTAECQAHQQVTVLRAVGEARGATVILRTVTDMAHSVDERMQVLQAMTREAASAMVVRHGGRSAAA